jgi:hypothetical protein
MLYVLMLIMLAFGIKDVNTYTGTVPTKICQNLFHMQMFDNPAPLKTPIKNIFSFPKFCCLLLFEGTFTSFFKDSRNTGFSHYFCVMMEDPDPYIRLTIRIQEAQRIRIRNTCFKNIKRKDPDPMC